MNSSENSRDVLCGWVPAVRAFGIERYGTLKAFAEALGMTPQNLNGYLTGERRPGRAFISRLDRLGYDIAEVLHGDTAGVASSEQGQRPSPRSVCTSLDLDGIEDVLGRQLESIAEKIGATHEEIATWRAGGEPSLYQMARILDVVVTAAIGAKAYARMLNRDEPSILAPASSPASRSTTSATELSSDTPAGGNNTKAA